MDGFELVFLNLLIIVGVFAGPPIVAKLRERLMHASKIYGQCYARCRLSGLETTQRLLNEVGLASIPVIEGSTIDRYDWQRKRILLRLETCTSPSLAAVAIAAHEVGHAQQFADRYWAARWTPAVYYSSFILLVLAILQVGYIFAVAPIPWAAAWLILMCGVAIGFRTLISLALEADANKRAQAIAVKSGLVDAEERTGFDQVLKASFLGHVSIHGAQIAALLLIAILLGFLGPDLNSLTSPAAFLAVEVAPEATPVVVPDPSVNQEQHPTENHAISAMPHSYEAMSDLAFLPFILLDLLWLIVVFGIVGWFLMRGFKKRKDPTKEAIELNNKGIAHLRQQQLQESLAAFDRAAALDPSMPALHLNRAHVLVLLGREDDALQTLDAIFAMPEATRTMLLSQPDAWGLRGTLRILKEQWEGAESDLSAALERKHPDPAVLYRDRCHARIRLRHFEEAIADGAESVRLNPNDAIAWNNLGVACSESGRYAEAIEHFRKVLELKPEMPNAHRHWAWLLATCPDDSIRNGSQAVEHAMKAMELSEWKAVQWFDALAAAYAEIGDFAKAVEWQERHAQAVRANADLHRDSLERLEVYRQSKPFRTGGRASCPT